MRIIKTIALTIICLIVGGSSLVNVMSQLSILAEAKQKNAVLETETYRLEKENLSLKQKITYATSSAFLEQQSRDKLGMGTENDYWVKLPADMAEIDLYPEINEIEAKQTAKQWINLFTP